MTAMPEQETTQPQPGPEPPLEDEWAILNNLIDASALVIEGNAIDADIWGTDVQSALETLNLSDLLRGDGGVFQRMEDRRGASLASNRETDNKGNVVVGDAMISIDDFTTQAVDVSFNPIDTLTNAERASMEWTGPPLAVTILEHLQHALDVMRSASSDDPQQAQCFAEIETLLICAVSELVGPRPLTHRSRRHVPREFP